MCVCVFGNDIGVHTCHKYIGNTHHTHTYLFIHIHVLIDLNNVHVGHCRYVYMFFSLGYKLYAVYVCVCVYIRKFSFICITLSVIDLNLSNIIT